MNSNASETRTTEQEQVLNQQETPTNDQTRANVLQIDLDILAYHYLVSGWFRSDQDTPFIQLLKKRYVDRQRSLSRDRVSATQEIYDRLMWYLNSMTDLYSLVK